VENDILAVGFNPWKPKIISAMQVQQTTNHILMVRPANFGFNEETAESNAFQINDTSKTAAQIKAEAVAEFDAFVAQLRGVGVNVIVAEDSAVPVKADAIFPNNWVSFHQDGTVITYPMYAPVRRLERQESILELIDSQFVTTKRVHLEEAEAENLFLEGTGSMIFDRPNKIVYACLSPRTNSDVLDRFCTVTGFNKVEFTSTDGAGKEIYHTNVMMALGETFCVICLDTILDETEKALIINTLEETHKEIIEINVEQMLYFAGNMLQVRNNEGDFYLVMSQQAYKSLTAKQIKQIEKHTNILAIPIETIETYGGGSVRCMMAEVFLEQK
jgi:hypothetical protein